MARRMSRRALAHYAANGIVKGDKTVLRKLAAYLIENQRTKEASLIVRDIEHVLSDRGVVVGTVTSAFPLDAKALDAIKESVIGSTKAERVTLSNQVNADLIGGYVLTVPGREQDASVRRALTLLRTRVKKV